MLTFQFINAAAVRSGGPMQCRISAHCAECGKIISTQYTDYIRRFESKRLLYDKEVSGIFVCRKCSKRIIDTNESISRKNSAGQANAKKQKTQNQKKFYENPQNRENHSNKMKLWADEKKNQLGEDYFSKQSIESNKKKNKEEALDKFNKTIDRKRKEKEKIDDSEKAQLINKIKNSTDKVLFDNTKSRLHKNVISDVLNLKNHYCHPILWDDTVSILRGQISSDVEIITVKSIKRQSRGEIKRGWVRIQNKILKFDSKLELSFILWKIDSINRNNKGFNYEWEGKIRKYYPDFIDINTHHIYEIKDKSDYIKNKILIDTKANSCNAILIFDNEIPMEFKAKAKYLIDRKLNDR